MGCAQSKVDNEESVARCKERKILMKEAVGARNAFAAGHSGFSVALKDTGAALSDYAHGEAPNQVPHDLPVSASDDLLQPPPPPPQMIIENLPPPPPLPNFSPSPIKRAVSMPEMMKKAQGGRKGKGKGRETSEVVIEEAEEDEEEEELDHGRRRGKRSGVNGLVGGPMDSPATPPPPPPPPPPHGGTEAKSMAWDYFFMVDSMPGPSLDEDEEEEEEDEERNGRVSEQVEPRTPERAEEEVVKGAEANVANGNGNGKVTIEHSKTAPPEFMMVGGSRPMVGNSSSSVNLMQVLAEIDDHFLRASESALEVSKLLEATRLHYHSNFADNRGF